MISVRSRTARSSSRHPCRRAGLPCSARSRRPCSTSAASCPTPPSSPGSTGCPQSSLWARRRRRSRPATASVSMRTPASSRSSADTSQLPRGMHAAAVIAREEELGSIEAFLAELAQGPATLVLSGEAGIGKTILWEAGVEQAERSTSRVLTCRGVEAEALLSFAGLSELLAPVLDETAASLPAPRRRALEIALLLAEPGGQAPDAHAIGLAVLDVLRTLAEQGPVLVGF